MVTTWQRTDLNTDPPSITMASTDDKVWPIDAGETITTVRAEFAALSDLDTLLPNLAVATINGTNNGATVRISGLTRGVYYLLKTVFSRADGTDWTKTTVVMCKA